MGQYIVDIGASAYPSEAFGRYEPKEGDKLYLFEPHPDFYAELDKKFKDDPNATVFDIALSDKEEEIIFYMTKKRNCSGILKPNRFHQEVRKRKDLSEFEEKKVMSNTLDNVLGHLPRIDYLKLDTEGSEYQILLGATEVLKKTNKIKCEVNYSEQMKEGQKLLSDVEELLTKQGFELTRTDKKSRWHADIFFDKK